MSSSDIHSRDQMFQNISFELNKALNKTNNKLIKIPSTTGIQ